MVGMWAQAGHERRGWERNGSNLNDSPSLYVHLSQWAKMPLSLAMVLDLGRNSVGFGVSNARITIGTIKDGAGATTVGNPA